MDASLFAQLIISIQDFNERCVQIQDQTIRIAINMVKDVSNAHMIAFTQCISVQNATRDTIYLTGIELRTVQV
jgi:hypothetical protein